MRPWWAGGSTRALLRGALTPVLLAGATTLFLAISVATRSVSRYSTATEWAASVVVIGVFLLLTGLLKSQLARADIAGCSLNSPSAVFRADQELLHDPTAQLLYARLEPTLAYIDCDGRPRDLVPSLGGRSR